MNDQSRISPCGIYRRGTGIACAGAFVWITLYPTIFYYQYLLRPYVPILRAYETAESPLCRRNIPRSRLIFSRERNRSCVYRFMKLTPQLQVAFNFHETRLGDLLQTYLSPISYLRSLSKPYFVDMIIRKFSRASKLKSIGMILKLLPFDDNILQ